jgi:hypothetical protein
MNGSCSRLQSTRRSPWSRLVAASAAWVLLALAACNGTAVVTMTSTASSDSFLAYRVGLVSVQLQSSSGKAGLTVLPAATTVDFTNLTQVSEVLGSPAVAKGSYKSALITLDYSAAQIVYDDGSLSGVALTPVNASGKALRLIQLTVNLDPTQSFDVATKGASQLALNFNLAASNAVNLSAKTVTVTPVIAASALPIDAKQVRIRGPVVGVAANSLDSTASTSFSMGVMPFNGTTSGTGNVSVVLSSTTNYEVNGTTSVGEVGLGQLATLGTGSLVVAYGTLSSADATATTTNPDGTTSTSTTSTVSFTATQVLAGSSVEGQDQDRVTGIVSARSGNTLTLEDATVLSSAGVETFLSGTTFVLIGPNTLVTVFGQTVAQVNSPQQITVGSTIDAFGAVTGQSLTTATLDASAGHVRLDPTIASGLVTVQGSDALTLNLVSLGGRSLAPFDFEGTGADPGRYAVSITSTTTSTTDTGTTDTTTTTGPVDLSNSTVGAPVIVTGLPNLFGAASPNFTASTLLDPTTINALLVVDWGSGTAKPFATFDSSAIDVDAHNSSIGARHQIEVGAQIIDIASLSSDPQIVPPQSSNTVYSIGHAKSSTVDNFNTYPAFITELQSELNGSTLATGLTAVGQYTTGSLAATSITLTLNN